MTPAQRLIGARIAYVGVLFLATLSGLGFTADFSLAADNLRRALGLHLEWGDAIDGVRNVALFAGFGAVWVVTSTSGRIRREIARGTVVGLVLSACVEGLQCFSTVRNASIADVATNTAGAFIGAFATSMFVASLRGAKDSKSYLGVPTLAIAAGYGIAVLSEALTPLFRSEQFMSVQGGPVALLRTSLAAATPLSLDEVQFTNIVLFAAAGFLAAMLRAELRPGSSASGAISACGVVVITVTHVIHGLFALPIRWEAVATDSLGFICGVAAAHLWLAPLSQGLRGARRARFALGAYAALLLMFAWRPFYPEFDFDVIRRQLSMIHFIPLASLSGRQDVFSAVHVGQQFFLYVPVGALLAVWPLRFAGPWSHLWPAVWFAFLLEAGHIVIAARTFDITNALIACAGLGVGWIIVRRSGFTPRGEAGRAR